MSVEQRDDSQTREGQSCRWRRGFLSHPLTWLIPLQCLVVLPSLSESLWLDEAYSALMARRSFFEIVQTLHHDAGPPLYYFVLRLWRGLAGESEIALRGLSWIFSVLTTFSLYRLCERFWNRWAAVFACLLWIVNPVSVMNAGEVRNYTLFAWLGVLFFGYLREMVYQPDWKKWVGLSVCMLLSVYNHNLAWFMIGAGMMTAGIMVPRVGTVVWLGGALGVTLLGYLPWLPVLMKQMQHVALTIDWVERAWSPWVWLSTLNILVPGGETPPYLPMPKFPVMVHGVFLVVWLIGVGAVIRKKGSMREAAFGWVWLMMGVGIGSVYLYSWLVQPVYLVGRSDFFVVPFWCMLTAYAVVNSWRGWKVYGWMVFMVGMSVAVVVVMHWEAADYREDDAVRYLRQRGEPGELVVCTGLTRPTMEYYLKPQGFRFLSFPLDMEDHLAHFNERWYFENVEVGEEAEKTVEAIKERIEPNERVWIIASERVLTQAFLRVLEEDSQMESATRIQTPSMGLRRLGEPIYILPKVYRP